MSYFQGFLIPVPESKKAAYLKMAKDSVPLFSDHGAQRIVECWGESVPRGDTTDMYQAVQGEPNENIVFSWIDWESKAAYLKAHRAMGQDERMDQPTEMPFDGMRMIYTGFETLGASGHQGPLGYVQGYVAPVPKKNRQAYTDMCALMRAIAIDSGAQNAADGWAEKIADGEITDFKRAVKAKADEAVAFGYVAWPSKDAFEQGSLKMREDKRMPPPDADMPFDGKRLIYGGFTVLLDTVAD